jgi:predicted nuclease with TOPRIM domain
MTAEQLTNEIEVLNSKIAEINTKIDYFELDESNYEEQYRDMLNEDGDVYIGGISFEPARILEEVDPIAYNCGLSDYVSSISLEEDDEYNTLVEELEELETELEEHEEELEELENFEDDDDE